MRASKIWFLLSAFSILAGCSGGADSQDQASDYTDDAVSTTFIRGSWAASDPTLGSFAGLDLRPDHKFFVDSTKILNGVAINGSSDGLVRQTGTWHLSTKKKTLTLDFDHGWDSPDAYSVVYNYVYTPAPVMNGVYIPGHEPEAKLPLTQAPPTDGSKIAYPTDKLTHQDSWCTGDDDCKSELEDGTSNEGSDTCNTSTNLCQAAEAR